MAAGNTLLIDGAAETPTSVSNGTILLSGITAGEHTVSLNVPSALVTESIGSLSKGGYESNEVTVTVTA